MRCPGGGVDRKVASASRGRGASGPSPLMMPGMDGITVLRKALETDPGLVGVIMTGQGTIPTAVEAMKAGAFDYLLKPFNL